MTFFFAVVVLSRHSHKTGVDLIDVVIDLIVESRHTEAPVT